MKTKNANLGDDLSKKCIIFMHVPKAGGTTLYSIINQQYRKEEIFQIRAGATHEEAFSLLESLPENQRDKLKVIRGHIPFGLHQHLSQPFTYITYLREPVKRVISNYFYLIDSPNHALYDEVVGNKMSLEDYVLSGLTTEVDNYQTRMFSGMNVDRFLFNKVPIAECRTEDLETAISNLKKYFCLVGLTNQFDESLLFLKQYFKWSNIYYVRRKETNYKSQKIEISESVLEQIKRRNEFDIQLYEYARKNFEEKIASQDTKFHNELEKFKKKNSFYSKMLKIPFGVYSRFKGL